MERKNKNIKRKDTEKIYLCIKKICYYYNKI